MYAFCSQFAMMVFTSDRVPCKLLFTNAIVVVVVVVIIIIIVVVAVVVIIIIVVAVVIIVIVVAVIIIIIIDRSIDRSLKKSKTNRIPAKATTYENLTPTNVMSSFTWLRVAHYEPRGSLKNV